MSHILILPILMPLMTAAAGLLLWNRPRAQQVFSLAGSAAHVAACLLVLEAVRSRGIQVLQVGNWPAPFGISLVADHLSALMLVVTGILGAATAAYARGELVLELRSNGFHTLFHVLLGGISGAFLTGDFFNLYVWFEVILMASFGMLLWGQKREQLDGAVKYVVINLLATLFFLMGLGLLYGMTGTLNFAHLHQKVMALEAKGPLTAVALIFMAAFGIKAGVFPFFFWLPASYHTPAVAVSSLFAGMLTKVGVYALFRAFSMVFIHDNDITHTVLLVVAGFTMVTGVLGAAAQKEFRRVLSFHIISQVGYMVLGLALWTPLAVAGAVFYLVHHMIVKANLFLVSGLGRDLTGTMELRRMGGIARSSPLVAALFFIPAFSLAGFPPLSGFWPKMLLILSSLQEQAYGVAAVAVAVGFMTVFSMVKIWINAFWKPLPDPSAANAPAALSFWKIAPVCALAMLTLLIGVGAETVYQLASAAAAEVMHPERYVQVVLKGALP